MRYMRNPAPKFRTQLNIILLYRELWNRFPWLFQNFLGLFIFPKLSRPGNCCYKIPLFRVFHNLTNPECEDRVRLPKSDKNIGAGGWIIYLKLRICASLTHTLWTHTQTSGQTILWRLGSSWGSGALVKGLTSVKVSRVERALGIPFPIYNPCQT